jgi:hypothetical protein
LNGFANIFVHNKIAIFRASNNGKQKNKKPKKKKCQKCSTVPQDTFWRQFLFDIIFVVENGGMLFLGFSSQLYQVDKVFQAALFVGTIIIVSTTIAGTVLKLAYYYCFHMWSDLINCDCHCKEQKDEGNEFELKSLTGNTSEEEV